MHIQSWRGVAILGVLAAPYFAAYAQAQAQADAKAAAVMADVRKVLGGEKKIAGLKGLSMRANYRREMNAGPPGAGGVTTFIMMSGSGPAGGGSQATGKIEIDLELPDKYLRSDIGSAGFALTRTDGFEGSRPFVEVIPNTPGMRIQIDNPASDPARAKIALRRSQTDLARLMLGLVAGTQPGFPVTYAYGGQAESPDGKADVIDVTGPEDFKARLFIDVTTHLPLMLTYMEAEPRMVTRTMTRDRSDGPAGAGQRGAAPGTVVAGGPAGAPGGAHSTVAQLTPEQREEIERQRKEAESTPPKIVEYRLFFSEYREVDGFSLPHHIARASAGKTIEEWEIKSYTVNPSFKADRFKIGS